MNRLTQAILFIVIGLVAYVVFFSGGIEKEPGDNVINDTVNDTANITEFVNETPNVPSEPQLPESILLEVDDTFEEDERSLPDYLVFFKHILKYYGDDININDLLFYSNILMFAYDENVIENNGPMTFYSSLPEASSNLGYIAYGGKLSNVSNEKAFEEMKKIVGNNNPAIIYIGEFAIIVGYSEKYVYVVKEEGLRILEKDDFLEKWNASGTYGPYLLIWFKKVGEKKTLNDMLIEMNEAAYYAIPNIRNFSNYINTTQDISALQTIGKYGHLTREYAANYFSFMEDRISQYYQNASELYDTLATETNATRASEILMKIAELEDEGIYYVQYYWSILNVFIE